MAESPEAAVVIPAYRQPGLLAEAIASVLAQRGVAAAAVVVDDGCPFPATSATACAFARTHPGRVFALRRRNGGLSAARNAGVGFVLSALPGCRAVQFLDADNRLHPDCLRRALAALEAAPAEIGWVYPDVDCFGLAENWSARGEYARIAHLAGNFVEAGSLVRRAVFEAGLRFDEQFREGFEDWDFWLAAGAAGFRGRHLPAAGFGYRKRPESLLADAERNRPALLAALRRKPAARPSPRALLALEQAEAPRFAIHEAGAAGLRLTADPLEPGAALTREAARSRLLEALGAPARWHFPPVALFAAPGVLAALAAQGLLRGVLWQAQLLLRERGLVAVQPVAASGSIALEAEELPTAMAAGAPLLVLRSALLAAGGAELPAIAGARCMQLRVTMTGPLPALASATPLVLAEAAALAAARAGRSAIQAEWRSDWRRPLADAPAAAHALNGCGLVLPHLVRAGERHLGFLLPAFELGGVERVTAAVAAALRRRGWVPHLFVARRRAVPGPEHPFASLSFLRDASAEAADAARFYAGAGTAALGARSDPAEPVGLLATMDAVINTHSFTGHGVAARLRKLGIPVLCGLHMVGRAAAGNPMGHPHSALAYEHAYDGFVLHAAALADWCRSQGIPEEKLILVPNAPGYATQSTAPARAERAGKLRALFLGRLDSQKGLDRLAALIMATRDAVEWRVVGAAVAEDASAYLAAAQIVPEPPVREPAALDALYAWADVLVLPSRFEGVPLTVLEAQRLGCVPVATGVGALAEAVTDGVDGVLVDGTEETEVVARLETALRRLAADRGSVGRMASAAVQRGAGRNWDASVAALDAALSRLARAS